VTPELYNVDLYTYLNPNLADVRVPLLSAGNWGGAGLHLRGNVEGWLGVGSTQKHLKILTREDGTRYHVQADNRQVAVDYIADWIAGTALR